MRDRAYKDKVVKVLEPLDTVNLIFNPDNDDRLAYVHTVYPEYDGLEISQVIKLGYEDYLNSKDKIENVVKTIEQRTWAKTLPDSTTVFTNPVEGAAEKYTKVTEGMNEQKNDNKANGIGAIGENSGNE